MEWIKTSDRLPEETRILGVHYGEVFEVYFSKGFFYLEYNPYARIFEQRAIVTHWMPLPDPPLEKQPEK